MDRIRFLASAALAFVAVNAQAADGVGRAALLTKSVNWASQASGAQVAAAYPKRGKGVGFANLGCILGSKGVLTQCRVVGEAPQGLGFGEAALGLVSNFKAHYVSGEEGAGVFLPLEFDPAGVRPAIDPINCLAPLCTLQIAPGKAIPAQP